MPDLLVPPTDLWVPPAHLWVPEHDSIEAAAEAADLARSVGLELDPEQRFALDVLLAERDGRWAALEACVVCARQNLKTFLFRVVALYKLFVVGSRLVIWSAHEFNTAMEAFRDLREIIDGTDWLRRRVRSVNEANGKEGIEFLTGQRIRFKARTKTGGRGLSGDDVFLDEAFALQPTHVGSLLPTMAARSKHGNPRIYYGSSAGQLQSAVLRSIRDRGRKGGDPTLAYIEWCSMPGGCASKDCTHVYGVEGCALDDLENIRRANPALERRISIDFVQAMRRSLPPEEYAREFAGWWEDPIAGVSGIPADAWEDTADRDSELAEPVTLGIDVGPSQASGAITACGGPVHVDDHRLGASWIVERLGEIDVEHTVTAVGVDPTGPAAALIPDLEKAGWTIRTTKNPSGRLVLIEGREAMQACEELLAAVIDRTFVHRDQHVLNLAAANAGRRVSGDAWKWSRRDSSVDITPLVAATWARHLWFKTTSPDDVIAMVIGDR